MELLKIKLVGITPLMMHSERLANPLDPATKELKLITKKRGKTDEDQEAIMQLEWRAGLYTDDNGEPALPSANVLAALVQGAKKRKLGPIAKSVLPESGFFRLDYDGPREPNALYCNARFVDYRSVAIQKSRTMRCRPVFPEWTATGALCVDTEIADVGDMLQALATAGQLLGIGDHRPQFGRFIVERA